MISYFQEQIKAPTLEKRKVNHWLKELAAMPDRNMGGLAYIFYVYEQL